MTAPRTPRQARANRLTGRILLAVVAGLVLLSFYLVIFVFPKRRAHAPSELREKIKPHYGTALTPVEPADSAPSAPVAPEPAK
jgi:hypothetical protein